MTPENGNGTLDKFHLGVSADGRNCMLIFIDEDQRAIRCTADFAWVAAFRAQVQRVNLWLTIWDSRISCATRARSR